MPAEVTPGSFGWLLLAAGAGLRLLRRRKR
jgi:MYXO-CTERM domain-containing protein